MDTCVALVSAYLRFNGYVAVPEQPVLVGEGRPYRYHTATDVDILAVRFPNAAVVVPRDSGFGRKEEDLHLDIDPALNLQDGTVDVIVGEVKQSRPRLNPALRERDVLYATLRRVDPGFDEPLQDTIAELIQNGEAECESGGRRWRFRLYAFGEGTPVVETGRFKSMQLSHAAMFLISCMRNHHQVWTDAQFGDPVLDLLHLFDKMGFSWVATARVEQAAKMNQPVTPLGLDERPPEVSETRGVKKRKPMVVKPEAVVAAVDEQIMPLVAARPKKRSAKANGAEPKPRGKQGGKKRKLTPRVHARRRKSA